MSEYLNPFRWIVSGSRWHLLAHMKLMAYFKASGKQKLARWVANRIQKRFSVFISHKAKIDLSVEFRHPTGIVIGDGVEIGAGSIVYQNVTIGGARNGDGLRNAYPKVGRNTIIFAGAVLVGDIRIGDNCVIGANSVVTHDVPDNATAVGAPARIIRKNEDLA